MSDTLALPPSTADFTQLHPARPDWLTRVEAFVPPQHRARLLPAAIGIAALVVAAILWSWLAAPGTRALVPGLTEADRALVVAALDTGGVGYTLNNDSGEVEVSEGDYHRARMLLAAQGLPKSAPAAGAALTDIPMGSSRAVEGERLRQSREADLARTIEAIDVVEQVRVHLAVEARSPFVRDRSAPTASVLLRIAAGRSLADAQADAIVHLVASSVPGLSPDAVSLVDQNGHLLSGRGLAGASPAERQLRLQAEVEERHRQTLVALLTPMLGEGRFTAQVTAELDFSERQATRETYPEGDARLTREEGSRESGDSAGGGVPIGIPGALSNRPPPEAVVTAAPPTAAPATAATNAPSNETYARQFQLGREVSVTRGASGVVSRLSVAVALANPPGRAARNTADIAAIEALVKGAIGFNAARGDVVTVSARPFVAPGTNADPAWWQAAWLGGLVRNVSALLVLLLGFFLIVRPMLRRADARNTARVEAQAALSLPGLAASGAAPGAPADLSRISDAPTWTQRAALVRDFVSAHPERSTAVIRSLLQTAGEGADAR
jgi:flagellar M-ring protein FliF